jgi:hypothetical protein
VPSVVKKTFTTENTEIHGAEPSVPLCGEEELTTENTEMNPLCSSVPSVVKKIFYKTV